MNEFLEILTHGRRFKAAVKELALEELKDLAVKLDKVIVDREEKQAEEQQKNAARDAKIEEIRKQMEEIGLSVDDLGGVKAAPKKRDPRPPKYQIEVDGEMVKWTGQGRMPTVFKNEIEAGRKIEDFLI
ncbi:H-NS histone family protein [Parashewanella spongiae]|uniref:DNA-binding protein n=1 Tax=Parashewanella spongiae TaxID=342950 RepID=A0A3A6U116_9GAMM|nr:H-NS family nucleoid-associated regulatory protein [Parashewanella spongiae]MCL1079636.1 H-NS histone family protein [Parashewanella spongiae]RJY19075.1 H-NS histone family protein [Parashewanella spongiae]